VDTGSETQASNCSAHMRGHGVRMGAAGAGKKLRDAGAYRLRPAPAQKLCNAVAGRQ
jgi:hypothetical protein